MTAPVNTVTELLKQAQEIIERDTLKPEDVQHLRLCIEASLSQINMLRCEAQTALDRL